MNKQITIIGGMGPQASLDLHRRLIEHCVQLGARDGGDFPQIRHLSLAIDDFISDSSKTKSALEVISRALELIYLWRRRTDSYRLQHSTLAGA